MLKLRQRLKKGLCLRYVRESFPRFEYNKNHIWLNLGCAERIHDGYLNSDNVNTHGVEILLNLNYPLPFKDNCVDLVLMQNVIGHVKHPLMLRKEIDRILKVGGEACISSCTCHSEHSHNVGGVYLKE